MKGVGFTKLDASISKSNEICCEDGDGLGSGVDKSDGVFMLTDDDDGVGRVIDKGDGCVNWMDDGDEVMA